MQSSCLPPLQALAIILGDVSQPDDARPVERKIVGAMYCAEGKGKNTFCFARG